MVTGHTIRVKITMKDGEVWYASAWCTYKSERRFIARLNEVSKQRNIGATYELASEEAYWKYRNEKPEGKRGSISCSLDL